LSYQGLTVQAQTLAHPSARAKIKGWPD